MLSILDYGLGNLNSIRKSLTRIGVEAKIISTGWELASAEKIILPGVGHFSAGMKNLIERGLVEPLQEQVIIRKKPILGLCLGMQLMTQHSEEGDMHGLGWFKAQTIRFFESNEAFHEYADYFIRNKDRPHTLQEYVLDSIVANEMKAGTDKELK